MEFSNAKISVIGAARSGIHAAIALKELGADVLLSDSQPIDRIAADRLTSIAKNGLKFAPGADVDTSLPNGTKIVVTSPGVPKSAPVLVEAVQRGIEVWSEIELAYRITGAPIAATTGTNGKTTITLLLAAMLIEDDIHATVCGNVSADEVKRTLVEAAMETRSDLTETLVSEVSSFQLEWVKEFAPDAAILTNVTPDHMDRYATIEEYAAAKANIFRAQRADQYAIVNWDDPIARSIGESGLPGTRVWFTLNPVSPDDGPAAWIDEGEITVQMDGDAVRVMNVGEMPDSLPGRHSIANVLAASAAALTFGASPLAIRHAVISFPGVAHRMEIGAEIDGVRYINNSMCTNVAAAIASLNAMRRPTIVIAGGADKELDYSALTPTLSAKAKRLILIGAAADKMERTFRDGGYNAIDRATTLEEAVEQAQRLAIPGDAVLLSPACASFDMFRDFEHRGAAFRAATLALREPVS